MQVKIILPEMLDLGILETEKAINEFIKNKEVIDIKLSQNRALILYKE